MSGSPFVLLFLAAAAIGVLVALVTWRKWNAFLALLIAAMIVGLGAGMAPLSALKAFQDGLGATLDGIAAVIALGVAVDVLKANNGGVLALAFLVGIPTAAIGGPLFALPIALMLLAIGMFA